MPTDAYQIMKAQSLIPAAAYDADTTPVAVDVGDFEAVLLALSIGAGGITFDADNKIEFKLTHSDDDSTYTAVADADVTNSTVTTGGVIKALVSAHATAAVYNFGYIGRKKYLKLLADFSGTHGTATPLAASAVGGLPHLVPVA